MRGKESHARSKRQAHGITPAYAGKSSRPLRPPECRKDHPRVCGEKQKKSPTGLVTRGSPPHVRGKGADEQGVGGVAGITPAYAGKRVRCSQQALPCTDHPRMCGEKVAMVTTAVSTPGSPPRMRGKDLLIEHCLFTEGITPAYAGKSRYLMRKSGEQKDHPRVCGEKELRQAIAVQHIGSPPRMRGKVAMFCRAVRAHRITPAYAGKREQAQ